VGTGAFARPGGRGFEPLVLNLTSATLASSMSRVGGAREPAKKPKAEEPQMDWLRSEDLKEQKNVTDPKVVIAAEAYPLSPPGFRSFHKAPPATENS
jgi:hypothetical protein